MISIVIKGNPFKELEAKIKAAEKTILTNAVEALKDATPVDTGEARDGWHLDENGNIVNSVEHIESLNDGTSQQAPAYFIEQTLLSVPGIKPRGTIVRSQ